MTSHCPLPYRCNHRWISKITEHPPELRNSQPTIDHSIRGDISQHGLSLLVILDYTCTVVLYTTTVQCTVYVHTHNTLYSQKSTLLFDLGTVLNSIYNSLHVSSLLSLPISNLVIQAGEAEKKHFLWTSSFCFKGVLKTKNYLFIKSMQIRCRPLLFAYMAVWPQKISDFYASQNNIRFIVCFAPGRKDGTESRFIDDL